MQNVKLNSNLKSKYVSMLNFIILIYIIFHLGLTLIFSSNVENWGIVARNYFILGVAYVLISKVIDKIENSFWQMSFRTTLIIATVGILFSEVKYLQHIFINGWLDSTLIWLDEKLFGIELSIAMQNITAPVITEGMMFAYTVYIPLLFLVSYFCYAKGGISAAENYLLNLSIAYLVCYIGFLFYPIAGPLSFQPEVYTVKLEGGLFTYLGEWIRQNAHYPGGNMPSPHCAAGTIMLMMTYKYNRNIYYVLLPIIILLYISTVYGRYHYVMDGVAGILLAISVFRVISTYINKKYYKRLFLKCGQ